MRFVCISDLHGEHHKIPLGQLPKGDVLLYAGDITLSSGLDQLFSFDNWLSTLPYRHKVIVPGNHDLCLQYHPEVRALLTHGTYLINEGIELDGIRIWGSPINATPGHWGWNDQRDLQASMIPDEIDILITHSPPYGVLDTTVVSNSFGPAGSHAGCRELAERLRRVRPRYMVCGHIHDAYGRWRDGHTEYFNVAMQDPYGRMFNGPRLLHDPVVLEVSRRRDKQEGQWS